MKMDAIIKPAPQKGLELVRKDVPVLSDGDALVKIHKPRFAARTCIFTIGTSGRRTQSNRP